MTDPSGLPIGGPVEHPNAVLVLVLGVLGLLCCGVPAPIAWIMGIRTLHDIERAGGFYGGRFQARLGMTLGIVGTLLLIVMFVLWLTVLLK